MTVENTLPHGLKTSVIDTDYETEDKENLALLDKNRMQVGLFANRPAVGIAERFYYATDTGDLYYDDGTSWLGVADAISGHAASHAAGGGDALTHQNLSGAGSNSHAQVDTHIADGTKHFLLLDEDDMASDDATKAASQQSIKAYADTKALLAGSTAQAFACSNLAFPASQVASADANTLDDYEEGSWTPTIVDDSLSDAESQTYTAQQGKYTKIGRVVYFECRLIVTSLGTLATSQQARIAGLPFVAGSAPNKAVWVGAFTTMSLGAAGHSVRATVDASAGYISLNLNDTISGTSILLLSEFTASGNITLAGLYTV